MRCTCQTLLYREFVGVGLTEATPNRNTLGDFRKRLLNEGIDAIFGGVNRQLGRLGLIGKDRCVLDGVHLLAKVAHRSIAALIRTGVERVQDAVTEDDPDLATRLERGLRDLHTEP